MTQRWMKFDLQTALLYAVFGGLWIFFSDRILAASIVDQSTLTSLQTYKGWGFVAVSAGLLFFLLRRRRLLEERIQGDLQATEERYHLLFENSLDAALLTAPDGSILSVNAAACDMFGRSKGEILRLGREGIIDASDPRLAARLEERARTGKFKGELTGVRSDGTKFPIEVTSAVFNDRRGNVRTAMIIRDITERRLAEEVSKRAEETLRASEERFRSLFENMIEGYAYCRMLFESGRPQDFLYLEVNDAFERLTGLKDVVGRNVSEVIPGIRESNPELFEIYGRVALSGTPETFETYVEGLGIWLSISVYSTQREYFVAVFDNVTERKRQEEKVMRLNRTYAMLSSINQLIVRERDKKRLFEKACQIAVNDGKFRMAWLGLAVEEMESVEPIASAGAVGDYLENLKITPADSSTGRGPTGTALREGRFALCNDIEHDERMLPWREKALAHGYRSSAAFPLHREDTVVGVMNFYSSEPNFFDDDEAHLLEGLAMDISFALESLQIEEHRKEAEDALRESEERYRLIAENVGDVIWKLDIATGRFTYVSPSVQRLRGFTVDEVMSLPMQEAFTPESYRLVAKSLPQRLAAFRGGDESARVQTHELDQPRKDGSIVPTEVVTTLVADDDGEVHEIIGVTRDITERKQAEKAVSRLEEAVAASGEAIFMTDRAGVITFVNTAFTRLYGYEPEEVIGTTTPRILKSGNQTPESYRVFWQTLMEKQIFKGEWINRTKEGRLRNIEATVNPILDIRGNIIGFLAIQRDVTEQRHLEQQMRQAQKLESLGTLASGIAHDFNNILAIIMGHSSLMERYQSDPRKFSESMKAITKATERGASLVRQMLTFARKSDVEFKPLLVNDAVMEIEKLFHEMFPKTITLVCHLSENLPLITADSTQLHQVLLNLCVNARDAMAGKGVLTISTQRVAGEPLRGQFVKAAFAEYVLVEVSDTGSGMDETTRQHIFEPFFTTKELGKGTGLGLAVVFGIMESHEGFIDVRSEIGHGTTFSLYFPVKSPRADGLDVRKEAQEDVAGGTETLLVVEDEEMVRQYLQSILTGKGYRVLVGASGEQAVEVYGAHRKDIALVISDYGLPEFSGHDLLKTLRVMNPTVKFILTSGYVDPGERSQILKDGAKSILQKPYDTNTLLKTIRDVLDK